MATIKWSQPISRVSCFTLSQLLETSFTGSGVCNFRSRALKAKGQGWFNIFHEVLFNTFSQRARDMPFGVFKQAVWPSSM